MAKLNFPTDGQFIGIKGYYCQSSQRYVLSMSCDCGYDGKLQLTEQQALATFSEMQCPKCKKLHSTPREFKYK